MQTDKKQLINLLEVMYLLSIVLLIVFLFSCQNTGGQRTYRAPSVGKSQNENSKSADNDEHKSHKILKEEFADNLHPEEGGSDGDIDYEMMVEEESNEVFLMVEIPPTFQPNPNDFNTEEYAYYQENDYCLTLNEPLSTFSIDVDKASYANVRRFLNEDQLPPSGSVRIEEMINYFHYQYPEPTGLHPFSITTEITKCPWNQDHGLLRIGIKGKSKKENDLPVSNLVFLVDVSGSMSDSNKLPLVKKSLKILTQNLSKNDRVSIVVYAGSAGLILPATSGEDQREILNAIGRLQSGGSTAGGEGIELAYKIAKENYIKGGNNRVILATDGDFNVGVSSTSELVKLIEQKRKEDIYLTICGFGMGNYKDERMEQLTNAGNGNYFYIDDIVEANRVFNIDLKANMFSIARDVKIQIEFNPALVGAYRLIGYENRVLETEDFDDDLKDAGELGAGHTVTALYELIPPDSPEIGEPVRLKYQDNSAIESGEVATVKFRYKPLDDEKSLLIEHVIKNQSAEFNVSSPDMQLAAGVASFGLLLRNSKFKGNSSLETTYSWVKNIPVSDDEYDYRHELLSLIEKSKLLSENQ